MLKYLVKPPSTRLHLHLPRRIGRYPRNQRYPRYGTYHRQERRPGHRTTGRARQYHQVQRGGCPAQRRYNWVLGNGHRPGQSIWILRASTDMHRAQRGDPCFRPCWPGRRRQTRVALWSGWTLRRSRRQVGQPVTCIGEARLSRLMRVACGWTCVIAEWRRLTVAVTG
jgi:hypothetical protein